MRAKIIAVLLLIVMIIQTTAISSAAVGVDETHELENDDNMFYQDEQVLDDSTDNSTNIEIGVVEIENSFYETQSKIVPDDTMDEPSPENVIAITTDSECNNAEENTVTEIPENSVTAIKEQVNQSGTDILENSVVEDETVSESIIFNRGNIVEDDFFGNVIVEIEEGNVGKIGSISSNLNANFTNNNEMMTVDESVYSTAPYINNFTSLRAEEPSGIRFTAVVTPEQRAAAVEYGFLAASTKALQDNDLELTFDITEITFKSGIVYSKQENIDKVFAIDENGNYIFSLVIYSISESNLEKYITARPYIIYNIDGVETIVYGNTYSNSVYRTAKSEVISSDDDAVIEYAQSIIDAAENQAIYLSTAAEVSLDERVNRNIGENPDIDVIKFVPEVSSFYSLTFTSDEEATYEVLDEFECELPAIEINNITNETAYLFEKGQTYYIRVKGEPDTAYSFEAMPCLEDAVIWDFASNTEGFTFHYGATGAIENGKLKISIEKIDNNIMEFDDLFEACAKKSNVSIDLFDYSSLLIRIKNETVSTRLDGTVKIDLDYDGKLPISYTHKATMPASMTEYQIIEFDFLTRYGNVSSLNLDFCAVDSTLIGDIYIDSIAILPMPQVLSWEFEENMESWSNNEQIESAAVQNGTLVLDTLGTVPGMAPAIMSPGTSAYDFDKYNAIKIRLKNETVATNMQVYFSTLANGHTSFNENKKFVVAIEPYSTEYVEYTINLTEHALFTDSLKDIMISIPNEGAVSIDYIRLYKYEITYDDVIWSFDNSLDGFTSNNERHTISINNGAMVVETQKAAWGAFLTPDNLELPTSEYRYLVLGMKSATVPSNFEAYFKTSTNPSYAENDHSNRVIHKHILPIQQSNSFKEYVIDLSSVPEGYTTGYTGNLQQFMFALPEVGTYEIDYIKLTNVPVENEDDTAEEKIYEFNVTQGAEYNIIISKNNNAEIGTYLIKYDADIFELVDACALTYLDETTVGQIVGTDISITSIGKGTVTFAVSDKTAAGVINCLKFKSLESDNLKISITTGVE